MVAFRSLKRARIKEDSQFAGVLLVSPLLQLTPVGPRAFISLSGYFQEATVHGSFPKNSGNH